MKLLMRMTARTFEILQYILCEHLLRTLGITYRSKLPLRKHRSTVGAGKFELREVVSTCPFRKAMKLVCCDGAKLSCKLGMMVATYHIK